MKRLLAVPIIVMVMSLLPVTTIQAHPPMKLNMSYEAAGGVLRIDVNHPVGNTDDHFIEEITVMTEGREAARIFYTEQMTRQGQAILVTVGFVEEGSEVTVRAVCSKFGELEKTGVVPEGGGEEFLEIE
ncbi:MAG: hypothetical protein ACLFN0_03310 [Thermovirgaceae bacterium]